MKLDEKDIHLFITEHQEYEIKYSYYDFGGEIEYNLCSSKLNIVLGITDSDENFAKDECIYIDYVYLEDGMKAWQVQINSKYLKQDGIEKLKELLPKFFLGGNIFPDEKLIKPLHTNCNFAKFKSTEFPCL